MLPGLKFLLLLLGIRNGVDKEPAQTGGPEVAISPKIHHDPVPESDSGPFRASCSPHLKTKFKMVARGGKTRGHKFICPPNETISSCRCPLTWLNGTKSFTKDEVSHRNPRVCSCRDVRCGADCKHRKDWVCRIDLRRTFGINTKDVSISALGSAINQATHYMNLHPLEQVEVYFRAGTYHISAGTKPAITLKHFKPENNGRFILSGDGMDKTTLVFVDWLGDMIYGYNVSQVTVRDLHLTRSSPGTTQGWVRAVSAGQVVLEIPPGFPLPKDIFNGHYHETTRTYLRKFVNNTSPQVVMIDNAQISWANTYQITRANERLWAFDLTNTHITPNYQEGDLIGVKSKCCGETLAPSYFFKESRRILFERVRWTRQSRGVFRLGTMDVSIIDCEIAKERPVGGLGWCLSTPDGGPQFGQPRDVYMHKVTVRNFYAENTGDDALAFFNVKTNATVENAVIKDAFSRSVLLYKSEVGMKNVAVERSPVCVNNNLNDIRLIFDFSRDHRARKFDWNNRGTKYIGDPDQLLGSNCTLIV